MGGEHVPRVEHRVLQRQFCGSEAGSYLRLIDFVKRSTLGLRVIKKKRRVGDTDEVRALNEAESARLLDHPVAARWIHQGPNHHLG